MTPGPRRPPFTSETARELATTHGATSPARVGDRAEQIAEQAAAAVHFLAAPDFAPALRAWARAEASLELLAEWIDAHGLLDAEGNPRSAVTTLLRFESLAAKHRARLGLDPSSRARLERELADAASARFDLEALIDEGRKTLAAGAGGGA